MKKSKKKIKKKNYTEEEDYIKEGNNYISSGLSYKRLFKSSSGILKLLTLKLSKNKTLVIKTKYDKKRRMLVLLDPYGSSGKRLGISYISDGITLFHTLRGILHNSLFDKMNKKKESITKFVDRLNNHEEEFRNYYSSLDFLFNKSDYAKKIEKGIYDKFQQAAERKSDKKSRDTKKSLSGDSKKQKKKRKKRIRKES